MRVELEKNFSIMSTFKQYERLNLTIMSFCFRFRATKEFLNGTVVQLSSEDVPQVEFLRPLNEKPTRNRSLCQLSIVSPYTKTRVRYFLVSFNFDSVLLRTKRPLPLHLQNT